jgi:LDH2 family malate/lactate/ureidoglycolate dehydrogenase
VSALPLRAKGVGLPATTTLMSEHTIRRVTAENARTFVEHLLQASGTSVGDAQTVARCLIEADLHGIDTHGANRLPSYMQRIRQGVLDPKARMEVKQITPVAHLIDAKNGMTCLHICSDEHRELT